MRPAPPTSQTATAAARISQWLDLMRTTDRLLLAGLRRRIGPGDAAELMKANRDTLELNYLLGWVRRLHLEKPLAEAWTDVFPDEALPV